jgi:hypothetical protein
LIAKNTISAIKRIQKMNPKSPLKAILKPLAKRMIRSIAQSPSAIRATGFDRIASIALVLIGNK